MFVLKAGRQFSPSLGLRKQVVSHGEVELIVELAAWTITGAGIKSTSVEMRTNQLDKSLARLHGCNIIKATMCRRGRLKIKLSKGITIDVLPVATFGEGTSLGAWMLFKREKCILCCLRNRLVYAPIE